MKEPKCANPNCQSEFIPNKYNPDRHRYCERPECKRYRDNIRQKQYYAKHCQDDNWWKRHRERKHRERVKRKRYAAQVKRSNTVMVGPDVIGSDLFAQQYFPQLLTGMAGLVSGSMDTETVLKVMERCLENGRELLAAGNLSKKTALNKLFLTPVRAGENVFPHARSP